MAAGIKLIPKRKMLWGGTSEAAATLVQHTVENIQTLATAYVTREITANDARAVLTLDQNGTGTNLDLTHATAPEMRFIEEDQTDPAGRFRWRGTAGSFVLEMAKTASWATDDDILSINLTNKYVSFMAPPGSNDWYTVISSGAAVGSSSLINFGSSSATVTTFDLRTGNGAGSNLSRLTIGIGSDTVDATWGSVVHTGFAFKRTTYTSNGAITTNGIASLNKTTPALAMTLADPSTVGYILVISQIDSGTAGHTITTATAGGFDGTNNTATFNAQYDTLILFSIGATRWAIAENIGVVLSAV